MKFLIPLIILLSSINSFAMNNLERDKLLSEINCQEIEKVETREQLDFVINKVTNHLSRYQNNNRHELNNKINTCEASKNSKAIIIAFEGTGAFEAKVAGAQAIAMKCIAGKISNDLINSIYPTTKKFVRENENINTLKWSGLNTGVQTELFKKASSRQLDWYSFPSEESEALSDIEQLKNYTLPQLAEDIQNSVDGYPKGVSNATVCINRYFNSARKLKIKPKIIVTTHSSGARAFVKFSEKMKKMNHEIDLGFTIDPVIEAHETIKEVLPQKAGEPVRWAKYKYDRFWGKNPDYPYSRVWSRHYPKSLYKASNVKSLISFYQQNDNLGLKIGGDAMKFGIYGSAMVGADENNKVKNLSESGHGEIAYQREVLDSFIFHLNNSLK